MRKASFNTNCSSKKRNSLLQSLPKTFNTNLPNTMKPNKIVSVDPSAEMLPSASIKPRFRYKSRNLHKTVNHTTFFKNQIK